MLYTWKQCNAVTQLYCNNNNNNNNRAYFLLVKHGPFVEFLILVNSTPDHTINQSRNIWGIFKAFYLVMFYIKQLFKFYWYYIPNLHIVFHSSLDLGHYLFS